MLRYKTQHKGAFLTRFLYVSIEEVLVEMCLAGIST